MTSQLLSQVQQPAISSPGGQIMAWLRRQGEPRAALLILGLCAWGLQGQGYAAASQRRVLPNAHEMSIEEPDGGASHYFFNEITNEVQWDDPGGAVHCLQAAAAPHLRVPEAPACTASAGAPASMASRQCLRSVMKQRCCDSVISRCRPGRVCACQPKALPRSLLLALSPGAESARCISQAHWFHSRRTPRALHHDIQG